MGRKNNGFLSFIGAAAIFLLVVMGIGYFSSFFDKENSPIESVESVESSVEDDESSSTPGGSNSSTVTPDTSSDDTESGAPPGNSTSSPDEVVSNCNGNHNYYSILSEGSSCTGSIQMISYCQNEGCNVVKEVTGVSNRIHSYENGICTVCGDGMAGTCTDEHYFNLKNMIDIELPTCTEPGTITYECTNEHCTHTQTVELAPWGHNYDENGVCTSCGEEQPDDGNEESANVELVSEWNEAWEPEMEKEFFKEFSL